MGLLDFFKRGRPEKADDGKTFEKKVESLGKKAADKRAQAYDRDEAIRALIEIGTHEAAEVLFKRFTLKVDPSITDQDEKQLAFDGIVSIGRGERCRRVSDVGKDPKEVSDAPLTKEEVSELRAAVIAAARDYCKTAESLTWPLKVMRDLLDDPSYERQLLELLSSYDTEYTRNVEPKINILAGMEAIHSDAVRQAVEQYLDDVNETVRFHAVQTTFEQGDPASLGPLIAMLANEESVRVKNKVADGILDKGWTIPAALRDDYRDATRDVHEYRMTESGKIEKVR
jgi:HEAT repeat protein